MTNGIILARKSTWTSKLDINYLDETSLEKRQRCEEMEIGKRLEQFGDYASKEELGEVHIAGFLHNRVAQNRDGTFTHPTNLENEERKHRIVREWGKVLKEPASGRGARNDVVQHRLVFSMSREMHTACLQNGLSPQQVLHESMRNVMKKFAEKFHPGDRISYAYGFHHDTDNLHVHVALCPRTAKGSYVGFSTPKDKVSNVSQNRDQIGFVRERCTQENRRWEKLLGNSEKVAQFADRRHSNRWLVSPRHSRRDFSQAANNRDVKGIQLHRMYGTLRKLHRRMEQIKAAQRQGAMEGALATMFPMRGLKPAIRHEQKKRTQELKDLQRQFTRLRSVYLTHYRAHATQPHIPFNHAYQVSQQQERAREQQQPQRRISGISV